MKIQDLTKFKVSHYSADTIEEIIPKIGKLTKNWKLKLKFNIDYFDEINNKLKLIGNDYFNELKYAIWDSEKYIKDSLFLNYFSEYEIIVLEAKNYQNTWIFIKRNFVKTPTQILLGIFWLLFTPFFLLWQWIKYFFSLLFFIHDNKLGSLVLILALTWVACYYSWDIAEALAKQAQMIAEIKKLWII